MKTLTLNILAALIITATIYLIWKFSRPTEIVAVHLSQYASYIVVKNFPFTDSGMITWWQENRVLLKDKYGVPELGSEGSESISVWNFGDGYQIEKPDKHSFFPSKDTSYLLCFADMKVKENCIVKDSLMSIGKTRDGVILFRFGNKVYSEKDNGEVVRRKISGS